MGEINHHQQQQIYNEEPLADHYVWETMHAHLGVIVHCEPEYSAVWSPDFQLVRIQLPTPPQDPDNQPVWPCCCWVNFRCIEEGSPLRDDVRCNYLAYDVKKVPSGPASVKQLGDCIAAPMRLKRAEAHSQQFFLAYDDFFGPVLCCARDKNITDRMTNREAEIEVYSIYTDTYQFSKWMAVLYKERSSSDGRWNKLEGLPPAIDSQVDTFFPEYRCSIPSTPFQNFRIQQQQNFSNINHQQQLDQQPSTSQQAAQRSSHNLLVGINNKLSLQQPKAPPHSAGGDIIGGQHIPTTSSMRSSFSTATDNEMMMARAQFPISSEDASDDVMMSNLDRYMPGKVDKRFNAIVVRKRPQYAIVYTQPYGDALVLPRYVKEGHQHFDRTFVLGRTIAMGFAPVKNQEGLKFKWTGLPKFKVPSKQIEPVRLVHGQFVQIHAICKFYERNIKLCTADEGMKPNEMAHCHYNIEEEVGKVLVDPSVLQKNRR